MKVDLGLEVCLDTPPEVIAGRRFGLLMNQASLDREFRYARDVLHARFPGQLGALFAPQHGFFGEQQDNMIESPHGREATLGIPVYSLYADRRRPTAEMLAGLELLVVDLQDVGTRVYTFIWTLSLCMEACAAAGIPVLVLDRPNPVGGVAVEGPLLEAAFTSFVGRAAIPMRHALTIGEMACFLNEAMEIGCDVQVVRMRGWERRMTWGDTGRAWVPPSPNLPRVEGVLCYPGQVLVEGTNLSEGRGTTTPFEVIGAPFVDGTRLVEAVGELDCGIRMRPVRFEPTFQKHAGRSCGGVFLHPVAPVVQSYRATVTLLAAIHDLWPDDFAWSAPPYQYEAEKMPIDILTGSDRLRRSIDGGSPRDFDALCAVDAAAWTQATRPHRIYD